MATCVASRYLGAGSETWLTVALAIGWCCLPIGLRTIIRGDTDPTNRKSSEATFKTKIIAKTSGFSGQGSQDALPGPNRVSAGSPWTRGILLLCLARVDTGGKTRRGAGRAAGATEAR